MAATTNGTTNGHGADAATSLDTSTVRFAHIPPVVEIPVQDAEVGLVDLNLEELADDPTELCILLEDEHLPRKYWTMVSMAYAKQGQIDHSIEVVNKAIAAQPKTQTADKLHLYNTLCWLYLLKSRSAPRVISEPQEDPNIKTKDAYLRSATATLNDASRLNPTFQPLLLARGVLCLLRAALVQDQAQKFDLLRQATKAFDDAIRASNNKNLLAYMGRARTLYSAGNWNEALKAYQHVVKWAPDIKDPDPRIGIGCCFWQLGYRDDARIAWQRALSLNPKSKEANVLLGVYHLQASHKLSFSDPKWMKTYTTAMNGYTQTAFKHDNKFPMSCAMFANFFLQRKAYDKVDTLARRAVELTDVSTVASDGWFSRARQEHFQENSAKAADFYQKSDDARGGDERGYLPAKFGSAQLRVLQGDLDGAKFRLEKIVQQSRSPEAMALLGSLLADDIFSGRLTTPQEIATTKKRAVSYLEAVRATWTDPNKYDQQDSTVLLNLARVYEAESPDRALKCLEQIANAEMDHFAEEPRPDDPEKLAAWKATAGEQLRPQLLNNIGCFHYDSHHFDEALTDFQTALKACTGISEDDDDTTDTDALVTTISYNLARTYEQVSMYDEAKEVYDGLLQRHGDYTDAKIRQVLIALKQSPQDQGPELMKKLYETDSSDLEVRALFGWYVRKAKRRVMDIAQDQEQRHYKHTLQNHDKHDTYALMGMGNVHMSVAREMKRDTEADKERRNKMYERAIEFFDKVLLLDPENAYAAQGIAIIMAEANRDFGPALQIFSKVKDVVRDANVFINLGHIYVEVKQYARAIESYEQALKKDKANDAMVIACLGRAWYLRGKNENSLVALNTALEYSRRALEVAPDQIHFKWNVAFVQMQIAQTLHQLPEQSRSVDELEEADKGLDEGIEAFAAIARAPNPPFPRNDIDQRANMGRNTIKKQMDRAIKGQRDYETANADRLRRARELRDADIAHRKEVAAEAERKLAEQQAKIAEDRRILAERDRKVAAQRYEEMRRLREMEERDSDDGNAAAAPSRKKGAGGGRRKGGSKRKKDDDDFLNDDEPDADAGPASRSVTPNPEAGKPRKKRKLQRPGAAAQSKFKSAEMIIDSDEDDDADVAAPAADEAADGSADEDDE